MPDAPPLTPADRAIVEAAAKAILAAAVEAAARDESNMTPPSC